MSAPSGIQYTLVHGEQRAVVTEIGATLRDYTVAGRAYVDGFDLERRATDGRGQVLAPWPNRLAEGRYSFDGKLVQAPLNEPSRGNAIHGLVRWLAWRVVDQGTSSVTLECALRPQPGYEWSLLMRISYRLSDSGLSVVASVSNSGTAAAPLGVGFHPYLTVNRRIDDLLLTVPALSSLALGGDPDLPPQVNSVARTPEAAWTKRTIGTTQLDTAFTDLVRGVDGTAVASLSQHEGDSVDLWVDEAFGYLMVYTGDQVGELTRRRRSVAIEPMTCPPNAFRSGVGVVVLQDDEFWEGSWGVRVRRRS